MLYIYCRNITNRLRYVTSFIFQEVLPCEHILTDDASVTTQHEHACIVYDIDAPSTHLRVIPEGLLSETSIRKVSPKVGTFQELSMLFPTEGDAYPFDIFSATFYLISRYEEYLDYDSDMHGRYPHTDSIAYRYKFLNIPLVNYWLQAFAIQLKNRYPGWQYQAQSFQYIPTFDIDIAWSYLNKGLLRNLGGWLNDPGISRLLVLAKKQKDPYDTFDFIEQTLQQYQLKGIFFILSSLKRTAFDKNISPQHPAMQELIKRLNQIGEVGIHPSYYSLTKTSLIAAERIELNNILKQNVMKSRQHYIRMRLPETYRAYVENAITDDYSMGYGSINGFRASTCHSFYWYDLSKEEITNLRVHPFCYMDANSIFEQLQDMQTTAQEILHYAKVCQAVHGPLTTIFHNHLLRYRDKSGSIRKVWEGLLQLIH